MYISFVSRLTLLVSIFVLSEWIDMILFRRIKGARLQTTQNYLVNLTLFRSERANLHPLVIDIDGTNRTLRLSFSHRYYSITLIVNVISLSTIIRSHTTINMPRQRRNNTWQHRKTATRRELLKRDSHRNNRICLLEAKKNNI